MLKMWTNPAAVARRIARMRSVPPVRILDSKTNPVQARFLVLLPFPEEDEVLFLETSAGGKSGFLESCDIDNSCFPAVIDLLQVI